jgi:hypothetical protein
LRTRRDRAALARSGVSARLPDWDDPRSWRRELGEIERQRAPRQALS